MRAAHPAGGVQDRTLDLRDAGYLSTTALTAKLGFAGTLSAGWIVQELKIEPRLIGPTGNGYYWAPEQVRQIRMALAIWLLCKAAEELP